MGRRVIDRLSRDLRREFPYMKGFSPRNLRYMRAIAEAWPDELFVQQVAAKLPWFHLCTVIDRVPDQLFYHLALHRYVVVELKAGEFRPEHAGQINFHLSAVDELLRDAQGDGLRGNAWRGGDGVTKIRHTQATVIAGPI